ncbi:uncharacterized protein LOC105749663 isoform X1 [Sarcophilus harrisii]|uniref:uncharacterized protein LOC105749663 isoform X1 n=1 Tax=Sarcophilus harrisii TaxID=9305 RepID=UPI000C7BE68A|nr:uncharacterized protein LOC105749663 isoform X1 [Sarcophilus harrisii]
MLFELSLSDRPQNIATLWDISPGCQDIMKTIRPWGFIFSLFSVSFFFQMLTLTSGEEEMMSMDPQVGEIMRNVISFWMVSQVFSTSVFLTDEYIKKHAFLWKINGILAVTSSLEVGVCICYLWTRHSCSGFIFKEEWMNWFVWSVMMIFLILLGIITLKGGYGYTFFFILIFSLDFNNIESIVFVLPTIRIVLSFLLSET